MMNAEQKQAARNLIDDFKDAGNEWDEAAVASHMTALLQELVDAPEPEPFGYFKSEPFGWTDCAETDDGAIALYTAPSAPSVPDGWIRAIDEAMVVHHIGIADRADGYEEAKKKLNELLAITSDIARYCSEPPADVARDAERYRWLRDKCRATGEHWGGRWSLVIEGPCPDGDESSGAIDKAIDAAIEREILGGGE